MLKSRGKWKTAGGRVDEANLKMDCDEVRERAQRWMDICKDWAMKTGSFGRLFHQDVDLYLKII